MCIQNFANTYISFWNQKIWDEVGESDSERDKMLFELEQECLDAYKRKVDQANRSRAQLRQAVADAEAQLADICAALGDGPAHMKKVKAHGNKWINLKPHTFSIIRNIRIVQIVSMTFNSVHLLF